MTDVPETRYAKTADGVHIAYQVVGSGPVDVVLFPALPCIDGMWDDPAFAHILRRLAHIGRLVCLDPSGVGASDPVPLGALPTVEAWVEDLVAVLDAVGAQAVTLIGEALVGLFAMTFAAVHPERTSRLVLIDATARIRWAEDYPIGLTDEVVEAGLASTAELWGTGIMAGATPSRAEDATFKRWAARRERTAVSPAGAQAMARFECDLDLRQILPTVRVPTVILARRGAADSVFDKGEHGRYIADHIPDARFIELNESESFNASMEAGDEVAGHVEEFITGVPSPSQPNRVLATVLFTDIVSSTQAVARLGDKRWTDLLDAHDAVINRELDRYRGRKVNPTGDGVLATFDGPARAVRCAQAIREAVRPLGIEVRAGLHTGEVELRGADIGGIAIHIGQRVCGLANANEVLVSRTVTDLVVGSGIEFEDRGEHELKGVPGAWRLFKVHG